MNKLLQSDLCDRTLGRGTCEHMVMREEVGYSFTLRKKKSSCISIFYFRKSLDEAMAWLEAFLADSKYVGRSLSISLRVRNIINLGQL